LDNDLGKNIIDLITIPGDERRRKMNNSTHYWSVILLFSFGILLSQLGPDQPGSTLAACYVAPGGDDNQDCTNIVKPCETINEALSEPGCNGTIFVATGIYTNTGDEVVRITKSINLSGGWDVSFSSPSGTSIIDGGNERRGIFVNSELTAHIRRFTIQNGEWDSGAGIYNNGTLEVRECNVRDNIDIGNEISEGGGIRNGGNGALFLRESTVRDNQSSSGAGVFNAGGLLEITNSTISGNSAHGTGGGINNLGGEIYINNSTISSNTDNSISGEPVASGIHNEDDGSVELRNSIIAGNNGPDCNGINGTLTSSGYNLIGDFSDCSFTAMAGDQTNVAPLLGILQDNGGLTSTHALLFGSLAINAGDPGGCENQLGTALNFDQRGEARVQQCDIGAFEFQTYLHQTLLPVVMKTEK
jgi:hypothetical protein